MFRSIFTIILATLFPLFQPACTSSTEKFTYAEPESHGFSSSKLDTLAKFLGEAGSSAMMIMVDGNVVFEWGAVDCPHTVHSIRKALLNSLYGVMIDRGKIDTTKTLHELGIDDIEPLSDAEKNATIADLLRSRSGVYHHAAAVSGGMLQGMPARGDHQPGEHYYYNNWDFNVLGAILEQETGESIYDMFRDEIAMPIGMMDFDGTYTSIDAEAEDVEIPDTHGFYQFERSKSKFPAYHFRLSARDMALYGQLFLNKGNWDGKRILSEDWIETSTKPYSVVDPEYGIGYGMLWRVLMKNEWRTSRSFFHTGAGIHMLGVYPSLKMVLVHRVDTENGSDFHQGHFYQMIDLVFDARE